MGAQLVSACERWWCACLTRRCVAFDSIKHPAVEDDKSAVDVALISGWLLDETEYPIAFQIDGPVAMLCVRSVERVVKVSPDYVARKLCRGELEQLIIDFLRFPLHARKLRTQVSGVYMNEFSKSYLGRLRQIVGCRLILMPGARLVLSRATRMIFLQKRADFGRWGFLGGSPEVGESLSDMIVREAMEEAGIRIEVPVPFGLSSNPKLETTTYPNGDRCQFFAMMYTCDRFTGEPRTADAESIDARWFDFDDLPSNCMPSAGPTIAAFRRWRATGQFQNIEVTARAGLWSPHESTLDSALSKISAILD